MGKSPFCSWENYHYFYGGSFNSYETNYQRVSMWIWGVDMLGPVGLVGKNDVFF
jgi:hypothetical protein